MILKLFNFQKFKQKLRYFHKKNKLLSIYFKNSISLYVLQSMKINYYINK